MSTVRQVPDAVLGEGIDGSRKDSINHKVGLAPTIHSRRTRGHVDNVVICVGNAATHEDTRANLSNTVFSDKPSCLKDVEESASFIPPRGRLLQLQLRSAVPPRQEVWWCRRPSSSASPRQW